MNQANKNLKGVIDQFVIESTKILKYAKVTPDSINEDDLNRLSDCILKMHHFAEELIKKGPQDETSLYNAQIVKDITEDRLVLNSTENKNISLVEAADRIKKEHRKEELVKLMQNWSREIALQNVVIDSLREISQELAA